jgi:capsular polysaccharide transport system permease protein
LASAPAGKRVSGSRRDGIQGLSGWRIQRRVVGALTYRELRTRVSEARGGFLGTLLQPLSQVSIWILIRTVISPSRGSSLNIVLFLASGIILFGLFSEIANRSMNAMKANEALLFYRPVKPVDTVIARSICETGIHISALLLVMTGTWIYLEQIVMDDLGLFFVSLLLMAVMGFSVGLLYMTASHLIAGFAVVGTWVTRVLWLASGIFYRYWSFPAWTRPFFIWNPLMHCIELNRSSMSQDYFTPDASLPYAFNATLIIFTAALWIYSNNERKLMTL